jgi:hypothetical protein
MWYWNRILGITYNEHLHADVQNRVAGFRVEHTGVVVDDDDDDDTGRF